jgi:hypothetical protein
MADGLGQPGKLFIGAGAFQGLKVRLGLRLRRRAAESVAIRILFYSHSTINDITVLEWASSGGGNGGEKGWKRMGKGRREEGRGCEARPLPRLSGAK